MNAFFAESHILDNEKISVVGACGKMGSGISLLLLLQLAIKELQVHGTVGKNCRLKLIDSISDHGFDRLKIYLKDQLLKFAEKNIITLREYLASNEELVSNKAIIEYFVDGAMDIAVLGSSVVEIQDTTLCFEATYEDVDAKVSLFKTIDALTSNPPIFFTNTSAIPISVLNEKANLSGRIIGFHFYNPPPIQKLLEIIPLDQKEAPITKKAVEIANLLNKTIVFSKDVAGFIGNGYLLREIVAGCNAVKKLIPDYSIADAVFMVDRASCEFLLRPMGIFQLVEYIGFDLALHIGDIMNKYLPKPIYGAEFPPFLRECRGFITKDALSDQERFLKLLGPLPTEYIPWKTLTKDSKKHEKIESYLQALKTSNSKGALIANELLLETNSIANQLVNDNVAASIADVNSVLENGFYHLYGAK